VDPEKQVLKFSIGIVWIPLFPTNPFLLLILQGKFNFERASCAISSFASSAAPDAARLQDPV